MLGKRIITGLTGIAFTIIVIHYGYWWFSLTIAFLALLAWREYVVMLDHQEIHVMQELGYIAITCLMGIAALGNSQETVLVILFVLFLALFQFLIFSNKYKIQDVIYSIFGILYIGLTFSYFIFLRNFSLNQNIQTELGALTIGTIYLWLALLGTWASDTFAFFVGSKWGNRKLCPLISPGKTIEGSIGGFIGCQIIVFTMSSMFHIPIAESILIGVMIGLFAPAGDLAESALKRFAGVKDSGTLLPGHGGVLDRFDSLLFTVPIIYYIALIF